MKSCDKKRHLTTFDNIQTNSKIFHSFSAGFLKKYVLQKHSKKVKFWVKLDFMALFSNTKGLNWKNIIVIKLQWFYPKNMIRFFSNIFQIILDHELLQFYFGHQSKVHRYKKVSTNRLLIMANLIYITLQSITPTSKEYLQYNNKYITYF